MAQRSNQHPTRFTALQESSRPSTTFHICGFEQDWRRLFQVGDQNNLVLHDFLEILKALHEKHPKAPPDRTTPCDPAYFARFDALQVSTAEVSAARGGGGENEWDLFPYFWIWTISPNFLEDLDKNSTNISKCHILGKQVPSYKHWI